MGTGWRVLYALDPGAMPIRLRERIEARLASIVAEMSQWAPGSVLSRFNRAPAGAAFVLPSDFATVLEAALDVARRTGGAFDPTHGRAAALLGYGATTTAGPPSDDELREARARAGWAKLDYDLENRRLVQPGGLWLDFSGIAKGFAVDAVADLLAAEGLEDVLVEVGGELAGRGLKPDGQPWWVDLDVIDGVAGPSLRIGLHDIAVATSAHHVRGVHTLDPEDGRPVRHDVVTASVIHDRAMYADAWATALIVLGPSLAPVIAERERLAARMLVRSAGRLDESISPALARMIDE
ncbi:FAD:protein FMN transferase [Sphingomonas oryzagri]